MPRLAQELKVARADGSYEKLLQRLQRMRLLIIDDWGLNRFAETRTRSS
jgi:DNA replication protein DnaC